MLSQLEESMPADKARAVAMQQNWPNGAMLFDSNGVLLQANDRAARELRESGMTWQGVTFGMILPSFMPPPPCSILQPPVPDRLWSFSVTSA